MIRVCRGLLNNRSSDQVQKIYGGKSASGLKMDFSRSPYDHLSIESQRELLFTKDKQLLKMSKLLRKKNKHIITLSMLFFMLTFAVSVWYIS